MLPARQTELAQFPNIPYPVWKKTGTRTVRLEEDVYERINARKRDDETFSETIDRLIDDYSLLDFAENFTNEDARRHRILLERVDEQAKQESREMLRRMGGDPESDSTLDSSSG